MDSPSSGTAAHAAQGVSLRWSSYLGDGGTFNRNFACDTNSGSNVLVGSFEPGAPLQTWGAVKSLYR